MVREFFLLGLFLIGSFMIRSQPLEFTGAIKLPATINSAAEEGMPLLSPDGKRLFFTRALYDDNEGGIYAGQDVWISEYVSGSWRKASNAIDINNKNNNSIVGISSDGKTFYFVNASPFHKLNGIHSTSRLDQSRGYKPELIIIPGIDNQDFIGFYVSPDLDVIFLSMKTPDSGGNEDLYYTIKGKDGLWIKPRSLGATINTTGFEISPFLSADKKRLYFASNGHGGSGDADIFYSERLYDSWETWSAPANLGSPVNSAKFDAYFSIYGDSVAFFASNREGKYADLYRVKAAQAKTILEKGQKYLTPEEWNSFVGKNVSGNFTFPHESTLLAPDQKELLFYIVNKLMLKRDIRFHLVVREEETSTLSKERIRAITDHMKQLGIDPIRIFNEQVFDIEKSGRGVIELRLFQ
jgi:hypothetical protein